MGHRQLEQVVGVRRDERPGTARGPVRPVRARARWIAALIAASLATCFVNLAPAARVQATFPGANGRIVFSSDRGGAADVYVMGVDGSAQTRLTNAVGDDQYPVWSGDGTTIAFSSFREGNQKLFRMNADGSAQTRLLDSAISNDEEPAFSPDGSKIAFRSDRELGLQIWTMNAGGSGLIRLTGQSDEELNINPAWSPISDRIAFSSNRDGDFDIYSMNRFGDNVIAHTFNDADDFEPAWSPDGRSLAFQSNVDGDFDIWVMDPAGTPTQLTNDPGFDSAPTWSPDGTKLAFQSNRDGDFEIFTMNADGSGVVQLTNNDATDRVADWQPLTMSNNDSTPPDLTVPALPVIVDATSPAGAVVSYTVSATDVVDPAPTVACTPPSGATFAIGNTSVRCTATDRAGNTATRFVLVIVRGASDQVVALFAEVINGSGLTPAQKAFLKTTLQNVLASFNPANPNHHAIACNTLGVFGLVVAGWSGHPIPPAIADKWVADARRIRSVLNC